MNDSIYEKAPKGPNFLLIVILACVAILVIFLAVLFFLHRDSRKMIPHGPNPAPNSRLVMPSAASAPALRAA